MFISPPSVGGGCLPLPAGNEAYEPGRDREEGGSPVHATAGDRLLVHGKTVGERDRPGLIIEVRGPDGCPPYVVRFDDGHTGLVFPGPDAIVVPVQRGS
ncbi:DUF1918 domain-containing protein [Sphaerisporangium melleum]|uniref:DUF1918 domain-containing protein n=1 Tax=Sphaerisporangium melleum TaxID=321316 RepID=UPI0027E43596|nr:DUF1918 domain-containing protein [Sphaerisporangium melleum]